MTNKAINHAGFYQAIFQISISTVILPHLVLIMGVRRFD